MSDNTLNTATIKFRVNSQNIKVKIKDIKQLFPSSPIAFGDNISSHENNMLRENILLITFEKFFGIILHLIQKPDLPQKDHHEHKAIWDAFEAKLNPPINSSHVAPQTIRLKDIPQYTSIQGNIHRFGKLAEASLEVIKSQTDGGENTNFPKFKVIFTANSKGSNYNIKLMIDNEAIVEMKCSPEIKRELFKYISTDMKNLLSLRIEKYYLDNPDTIKVYTQDKQEKYYVNDILLGSTQQESSFTQVGEGGYGKVYLQTNQSETIKPLIKKIETLPHTKEDSMENIVDNCSHIATKLADNMHQLISKTNTAVSPVSINFLTNIKYKVSRLLSSNCFKNIKVNMAYKSGETLIADQLHYQKPEGNYAGKVVYNKNNTTIKIYCPNNVQLDNERSVKSLLNGLITEEMNINDGVAFYDKENNCIKYIYKEEDNDYRIKIIELPQKYKNIYEVREYLYDTYPINNVNLRLPCAIRKSIGNTEHHVKSLSTEDIDTADKRKKLSGYLLEAIFKLQVAGGFGLDGKKDNFLVKVDNSGVQGVLIIDRDADLLMIQHLLEPSFSVPAFEHFSNTQANKHEQNIIFEDSFKGAETTTFFKEFFGEHSLDESTNPPTIKSEIAAKYYIFEGIFAHFIATFPADFFEQHKMMDNRGKIEWDSSKIETVRSHFDQSLVDNIAELMMIDNQQWPTFRDDLLNCLVYQKLSDILSCENSQTYREQFSHFIYKLDDHIKKVRQEIGINANFSASTGAQPNFKNLAAPAA